MNPPLPPPLLKLLAFGEEGSVQAVPISGGLIHQTYRVSTRKRTFLLQSINRHVFPNPAGLIQNHLALYQHFNQPQAPFPHPLAQPLPFSTGEWLFEDAEHSWRLTSFLSGTHTLHSVKDPEQAAALAEFFARFTNHASQLDQTNWQVPLPGFHDLSARFDQFERAIAEDKAGRVQAQTELIGQLRDRIAYVDQYLALRRDPDCPLRMMHHDAKLSNVLIDNETNAWLCPIDLDTVMPGYFFSDLGDMMRSICNGAALEDAPTPEGPFRSDLFDALLAGYRKGMAGSLSPTEERLLERSGILMTYMQALRFLTDHLNGDVYYRTDRPAQNLDRTINQFTLLKAMEAYV